MAFRGTLKNFFPDKGFGFIKPDANDDEFFFHVSSFRDSSGIRPVEGEPVEFDLGPDPKDGRQVALDVTRLEPRCFGEVTSFDYGWGKVRPDGTADSVFVHHNDIVGRGGFKNLEIGERVEFSIIDAEKGMKAVRVRQMMDTGPPLERFAILRSLDERLDELAKKLAQPEPWDYKHTPSSHPLPILRSYLYYTFARLESQGKLKESKDEKAKSIACFNTGLVTEGQEEIFAFFFENPRRQRPDEPKWVLDSFIRDSDHRRTHFAESPELATYFEEPGELLYDVRVQLTVNMPHITEKNIKRFPEELQQQPIPMLSQLISGAIEAAKRRVRRNYKTAIPHFHKERIQMLLPLCLRKPETADLALVVSRENQVYRASTVLTLDMAYNNARLIARPDREWLEP
ncbi:MAG: DUF3825 domain-containing protein [Thermoanaerobaculia bacterium]